MKYKLKLTVNGAEYISDLRFTDFIKNIFDNPNVPILNNGYYGGKSLTENLTGEFVAYDYDHEETIKCDETSFDFCGKVKEDVSGKSGTIKKIALVPDNLISTNYENENMPSLVAGRNQAVFYIDVNDDRYYVIDFDTDSKNLIGTSMVAGSPTNSIYKMAKIAYTPVRHGLKGRQFEVLAEGAVNANRAFGFGSVSNCSHRYAVEANSRRQLYESESEQGDGYVAQTGLLYGPNSGVLFGGGQTMLYDDFYYYFFEFFAYSLANYCILDNDAVKPEGYDIYKQGVNYQFDKTNFEVINICNFARIPKPNNKDGERLQGSFVINGLKNNLVVDTTEPFRCYKSSDFNEINIDDISFKDHINRNDLDTSLQSGAIDNDFIYLGASNTSRAKRLYKINKSLLIQEVLPEEITAELVLDNAGLDDSAALNKILNFCHIINRKNYNYLNGFLTIDNGGTGYCVGHFVDKETGVADNLAPFLRSYSAFADFEDIEVKASDVIKVEIIEEIEQEGTNEDNI